MKKEILLYTYVSGVAWLVDVAVLYLLAMYLGMPNFLAAAIAYSVGLVVHYALSVRWVFTFRRLAGQSHTEMLLYALTGLVGVVLSAAIVQLGSVLGLPLIVSKIIATGVTFFIVFAIRKTALFSESANQETKIP